MGAIADLFGALHLDDTGFEAEVVKSSQKAADAATRTLGQRVSGGLKTALGTGLTLAAGGAALALGVAAKGALELEDAIASFQAATGASADEAAAAGKTINRVAGEERASLASVSAVAIKVRNDMGLIGPEADKMTAAIVRFARVTKQDAAGAAAAFDDIMDAWHVNATDIPPLMDKLFASMQKFGGSVEKRQADLTALAPAFHGLGLGIDDALGLLNLFETAGLDAASAQRGLNSAITKLPKGETFQQFIEKLATIPDDSERARAAIAVLGAQAGPKFAQAIRPGIKGLSDFEITGDAAFGSVNTAAEVLDSTISGRIQKALSEASAGLREFGSSFGPALTGSAALASLAASLGGGKFAKALTGGLKGAWTQALGSAAVTSVIAKAGSLAATGYLKALYVGDAISGALKTAWLKVAGTAAVSAVIQKAGALAATSYLRALIIGDALGGALSGAWAASGGRLAAAAGLSGTAAGTTFGTAFSLAAKAAVVIGVAAIASAVAGPIQDIGKQIHEGLLGTSNPLSDFGAAWTKWRKETPWPLGQKDAPDWAYLGAKTESGLNTAIVQPMTGTADSAGKAADDIVASIDGIAPAIEGIASDIKAATPVLDAASAKLAGTVIGNFVFGPAFKDAAHAAITAFVQGINDKQSAVQQAFAALKDQAKTEMTKTQEQAYLIGVLTSKELASGLKDGRPGVRTQAEETRRQAIARLAELTPTSGKLGKAAMEELAKAIKSKDPVVRNAALKIQDAIKNNLVPPTKPLADKAHALGAAIAKALKAGFGLPKLLVTIGANLGSVVAGLFPHRATGGPVSAGIPYVVGENRAELFVPNVSGRIAPAVPTSSASTSAGSTTNISVQLPVTARPDPFETATQLRRMADFGVLSPVRLR